MLLMEELALTEGNKVWENRLRRQAQRLGLALRHSRAKRLHMNDRGLYQLVDSYRNVIVAGEKFDCGLEEVEEFLHKREAELHGER
jgi:hypothetical protein